MSPRTAGLARRLAALATLATGTLAAAAPQADLDLNGTRLRPACSAEVWPAASAAIAQAAAGRDAAPLGTLLQAYLCDEGETASALLRRHAPRRIVEISEGTGQDRSRQRVDAAEALAPRGGRVYGLSVQARREGLVEAQWHADEACVRSVSLAHRGGTWRFVEIGSACD